MNDFFRQKCIGYAANRYAGSDLADKLQYLKHADGRDEGLTELDEASPEAFDSWYHDRKRYGGHPWEVCRGGNSTHVSLRVLKDEHGYFFSVDGDSYSRSVASMRFFLAIRKAGLPVQLYHAEQIASRFSETDKIGIVPTGVMPVYCSKYFPDEIICDFMNLPSEKRDLVISQTAWQPIPKQSLMNEGV